MVTRRWPRLVRNLTCCASFFAFRANQSLLFAVIKADPSASRFTLKMRDEVLTDAIVFLRSKGVFPEADSDSDDDVCYGDDFFGAFLSSMLA